jgi:intracellular sulfur oxidation DsrE/DsrF family protein
MNRPITFILALVFGVLSLAAGTALAAGPVKVVYDVAVQTPEDLQNVLTRASHLSKITGADTVAGSIQLVLHGPEVDFFAKLNYEQHKDLVDRARSLTVGDVVQIKMSALAVRVRGFAPEDMQDFVQMVPFGDSEIARLQNDEGHAYIQASRSLAP